MTYRTGLRLTLAWLIASGFAISVPPKLHAQSFTDFEIKTDAGEKFHLVHTQGSNYDIYTEADNKKIGSVDMRTHNPVVIGPDYAANGAAMQRGMAAANEPGHMSAYTGPAAAPQPSAQLQGSQAASGAENQGGTQSLPPCPLGSIANYWNGSSWAPLRTPEMLNGKQGFSTIDALKNPFNERAGATGIARFRGPGAPVTVGSSPQFCFFAGANFSPEYLIGSVDVKEDHREIEFHQSNRGPEKWIPPKGQKQLTSARFGTTSILITTIGPLPPGQYIIGTSAVQMYDFGVQ